MTSTKYLFSVYELLQNYSENSEIFTIYFATFKVILPYN